MHNFSTGSWSPSTVPNPLGRVASSTSICPLGILVAFVLVVVVAAAVVLGGGVGEVVVLGGGSVLVVPVGGDGGFGVVPVGGGGVLVAESVGGGAGVVVVPVGGGGGEVIGVVVEAAHGVDSFFLLGSNGRVLTGGLGILMVLSNAFGILLDDGISDKA